MSTYETLRSFVANWGTVYFAVLFVVACAFALRPSLKREYDDAARMPLRED